MICDLATTVTRAERIMLHLCNAVILDLDAFRFDFTAQIRSHLLPLAHGRSSQQIDSLVDRMTMTLAEQSIHEPLPYFEPHAR